MAFMRTMLLIFKQLLNWQLTRHGDPQGLGYQRLGCIGNEHESLVDRHTCSLQLQIGCSRETRTILRALYCSRLQTRLVHLIEPNLSPNMYFRTQDT